MLNDMWRALFWIEDLVKSDGSVESGRAADIAKLPFLDSLDPRNDIATLVLFITLLRYSDPVEARTFLANPALQDATWPAEVAVLYLESQGPEITRAMQGLPWMYDGIDPQSEVGEYSNPDTKATLESQVAGQLFSIYIHSPESFLGIVAKSWVQDGLSLNESGALNLLRQIASKNEETAALVVNSPFLETFELADSRMLIVIADFNETGLRNMLADPLLSSGISDDQIGYVSLLSLRTRNPDAAALVDALPWVQDGLVSSEQEMAFQLYEAGLWSFNILRAMVEKPWMQDTPHPAGVDVMSTLLFLSNEQHEAAALEFIDMPFLDTIDGVDAQVMRLLWRLVRNSDDEILQQVLSHPTLLGGITDEDTVAVAALNSVTKRRPDLVDVLLNPEAITVERRQIQLPYTGEMVLSVVHLTPVASFRTMDFLEKAVRSQESFMKMPFPRTYASVLVADVSSAGGGGSPNGLSSVDPGLEESEKIIAHEVAHTYWADSPIWIAEGGAEFFSTFSTGKVFLSNSCSIADNLSELDSIDWERRQMGLPEVSRNSGCAYTLGRALFINLHESLGVAASSAGFGRFYKTQDANLANEDCDQGEEIGFCRLMHAFVTLADEKSAAIAEPIIRRHYYGE